MGIGVLSVGFSSKNDTVGKSCEIALDVFAGPSIACAEELFFSFFLANGDDKVCSNVVGVTSVSEPEVSSAPVSVPDDPFG